MTVERKISKIPDFPEDEISKKELKLAFSGDAYAKIEMLQKHMRGVKDGEGVILKAIALLLKARGKQIQIRDPKTGDVEIVTLWNN